MKLWAGRFQKETDSLVNDFNSSVSFDARMYREDIAGSIAHAAMLDTLTVRPKNMARAASGGFINATDCADYLVRKGMPFRDAYMIVGRLVNMCIKSGDTLDTLPLKDFQSVSGAFGPDVYQALELKTCVGGRKVYGGPSPESVKMQIENIQKFVDARA